MKTPTATVVRDDANITPTDTSGEPARTARVARLKIARINAITGQPVETAKEPVERGNGHGRAGRKMLGKWVKDSYWYFTHERHCDRCGQTFSWRERRPNPKPAIATLMGESRAWTEREHTCALEVVLREAVRPRIATVRVA